jgi:hypothetical protein
MRSEQNRGGYRDWQGHTPFVSIKHMMYDFGTGNNNKLNWVLEDKQELIDIIETIYRGAKKGRGLVVSPKGELNFCPPSGTEG